jgi:hypothetical protein
MALQNIVPNPAVRRVGIVLDVYMPICSPGARYEDIGSLQTLASLFFAIEIRGR